MSISQQLQFDNTGKKHQLNGSNGNSSKSKDSLLTGVKLEQAFNAATETIQSLPKNGTFQPSNELLLKFYGYFKQATCGPCNKPRPGMFKVVERAKWDAWNSVRNLNKEQAMNLYIDEIKNIIETMPHSETVQKFLDILGPFYEYVDENNEPINNNNNNNNLNDLNVFNNKNNENKVENSISNEILINEKILKQNLIDYNSINTNTNTDTNGTNINGTNITNNHTEVSDDEEDFCDTNDNIDTIQTIKVLKSKINNQNNNNNNNFNGNYVNYNNSNNSNGLNGYNNNNNNNNNFDHHDDLNDKLLYNNNSENYHLNGFNDPITMVTATTTTIGKNNSTELPFIINEFGGESNTNNQSNYPMQNQTRPSRPNSTHSINRSLGNVGGGIGSGGFGSQQQPPPQPPNDPFSNITYLSNDTNRQILLLLMRLQQDTNNVLTRLSYLEATVMSIQNSLQMNRIENTIQANQRNSPIMNSYSNGNGHSNSFSIWSYLTNINIDWKTVLIAAIGPIVIRLVFILFRRLRSFLKMRRNRRLL